MGLIASLTLSVRRMAQKLCLGGLNVKELDRSWIGQHGATYPLTAAGCPMRMHGQTKLGFCPLPVPEIGRLSKYFAQKVFGS
jgi:hypothetical protein